jgi:hypothetical protein
MAGICLGVYTATLATLAAVGCGGDDPKVVPRPDRAEDAGASSAAGGETTNGGTGIASGESGSGGDRPEGVGGADGDAAGSGAGGEKSGAAGDGGGPDSMTELEPAAGWEALTNQISPGTADAHAPRVAFDLSGNGVAFAIWTTTGAGGDDVYVSRFAQGLWSAPVLLTPASALGMDPQIAADAKGNAVAIWRQPEEGQHTIFTARYSATTSGWATAQPLPMAAGIDVEAPAISAEADGYVVATWRVVERENGQIASANVAAADLDSSVELATWQLRAPLARSPALTGSPRLALNSAGSGFVVWDHGEGDKRAIYAARYARVIGFEPALKLGFSDFDADSPDVAVNDNGDAVVVWRQRGPDGSWGVSLNRFAAVANAWAPVSHALTDEAAGTGEPRVASNRQGAFTCAWWQLQDGKRSLFGSRGVMKANGEGSWTAGSLIETDDRGDVGEPAVAVRKDGTALVAWAQSRGSYDQIVLASSLNSGWQLGTLQQDLTRRASTPFVGVVPDSNHALALWTEVTGPAPGVSSIWGASFTAQ